MSRYELDPDKVTADRGGAFTLAVGWDRPMGTYFMQLATDPEDRDQEPEILHWIGGDFNECQDVDQLVEAASAYASGAAEYRERLLADRRSAP